MRFIFQAIIYLSSILCSPYLAQAAKIDRSSIALDQSFMKAQEVSYNADEDIILAHGGVTVQWQGYILTCDKIKYNIKEDIVVAQGNIRIQDKQGRVFYGERAMLKDRFKEGVIIEFAAKLSKNSLFAARKAEQYDARNFILEKSVFSPCERYCKSGQPLWQIKAERAEINHDKQKVIYKNLFFELYGLPVLYLPYLSHATPGADAKSGILMPSVKDKSVLVPLYFRIKPNIDLTIIPHLSKDYKIMEAEWRHRTTKGTYVINGSGGGMAFKSKDRKNTEIEHYKYNRYYIHAKGDFSESKISYGFDVNRTSDKAYIIEYHDMLDPYLTSSIYFQSINDRDFILLNSFIFQDLRSDKENAKEPFIIPQIQTKNIIPLNDDESVNLTVRENFIFYNIASNVHLLRNALDLDLNSLHFTDTGYVIKVAGSNRFDIYNFELAKKKNRQFIRNIPEAITEISYPLASYINKDWQSFMAPKIMAVIGKEAPKSAILDSEIAIDQNNTEITSDNIFKPNKFVGIDYHEYNKRLSYGTDFGLAFRELYFENFIGASDSWQDHYKDQKQILLSNNIQLGNGLSFFLDHKYTQKFATISRDAGIKFDYAKWSGTINYAYLNGKYNKRLFENRKIDINKKLSRLIFAIKNQLSDNFGVEVASHIDISKKSSTMLMRSLKATYDYDCIQLKFKVSHKMLSDEYRGIKQRRSIGFSVGLKVINL